MFQEWMVRRARNSRVFILGAGFSAGAGVPLTGGLLPLAMKNFAEECPGLFSRIDEYAGLITDESGSPVDYSKINFRQLCDFMEYVELNEYAGGERFSDAGCREKLGLRYFLAKTITQRTPTPSTMPRLYLEFAEQLHEGDMVVTFNWDALLEIALMQVKKRFTYNGECDGSIKLAKLHGSINWRVGPPQYHGEPSNHLGWQALGYSNGVHKTEIYQSPKLIHPGTWDHFKFGEEVQPFLVLPGYGKAFDVRENAWNWYKPWNLFMNSRDVFIVGLSLSADDFLVRSMFLHLLRDLPSYSSSDKRMIWIINPDYRCKPSYEFILSTGRAQLVLEPFSTDHVELMKESRSGWDDSVQGFEGVN